jgi:hypothetical protein
MCHRRTTRAAVGAIELPARELLCSVRVMVSNLSQQAHEWSGYGVRVRLPRKPGIGVPRVVDLNKILTMLAVFTLPDHRGTSASGAELFQAEFSRDGAPL